MTACGYTPAQIDELAMTDALALLRYWRHAPPMHELLAIIYQITPPEARPEDVADPSGIGALMARYPGGRVKPG